MVVVGYPCDFCAIVARLSEEAGDFDDRSHGNGAIVRGEGVQWLLGGALVRATVGDRAVLLVVVWRPGSERRWDFGRLQWLGT